MQANTRAISLLPPRAPISTKHLSESRALERKLVESQRAVREWRQHYEDLLSSMHDVVTPLSFTPPESVRTVRVTLRRVPDPEILPIAEDGDK
jgi:hypothetical protein